MSQRRSMYWVGAALAIALLCVATAEAQRQGQGQGRGRGGFGGGPGGFGADPLMLLGNEKVQGELDLTAEQKDGVKKLSDEVQSQRREAFSSFQNLSDEERREKFAEMGAKMREQAKATQAKVDALLLPPQVERLKQLRIQRMGAGALSDQDVAKALNISEDQQKQLAAVREESFEKMRELRPARGAEDSQADRDARRAKMTAMQKEISDKLLAVLNADQKAQFEKMQGEKFEFPADMGFGRGGGRFGAGGQGQGGGRQRRGGNQGNQ